MRRQEDPIGSVGRGEDEPLAVLVFPDVLDDFGLVPEEEGLMVTADEVSPPTTDWIGLNWERARQMGDGTLFVIDEVQKIPDWSRAIKLLYDQDREAGKMKVVLLGSASLGLQKGLSESLAGRYEIIPAHHWNLAECHEAFGWDLDTFLAFGGYPAAADLCGEEDRWQSLFGGGQN